MNLLYQLLYNYFELLRRSGQSSDSYRVEAEAPTKVFIHCKKGGSEPSSGAGLMILLLVNLSNGVDWHSRRFMKNLLSMTSTTRRRTNKSKAEDARPAIQFCSPPISLNLKKHLQGIGIFLCFLVLEWGIWSRDQMMMIIVQSKLIEVILSDCDLF